MYPQQERSLMSVSATSFGGDDTVCRYSSISCNKHTILVKNNDNARGCTYVGADHILENLYLFKKLLST